MVGLTSAAGVVAFLSEPDHDLQVFALRTINDQIETLWAEVAATVENVEALFEDETFPERELAALVASKIYYNLQEYSESMAFALGAGKLFDIDHEGEFEDTIISNCIDTYILISSTLPAKGATQPPPQLTTAFPPTANGASSTSASLTSPTTPFSHSTLPSRSLLSRQDSLGSDQGLQFDTNFPDSLNQRELQKQLLNTIDRLFTRCFDQGRYRQVVGIAVEAKRLDVVRTTIQRASEDKRRPKEGAELLEYVLDICMDVVQERGLRIEVSSLFYRVSS